MIVLIIGTNPLPNYVVADYLKDKDRQFCLVYSEERCEINQSGTYKFAESIKEQLVKNGCREEQFQFLPLSNVSLVEDIRIDLQKLFSSQNFERIHLNYTGGTKVMAACLHEFIKEKFPCADFSYLDARTYKLLYDDRKIEPETGDMRTYVSLDISTLLSLHGYNIKEPVRYFMEKDFGKVLNILINLLNTGEINEFIEWKDEYLRKIFYDEDGNLIDTIKKFKENIEKESLSKIVGNFPTSLTPNIKEILNSFPDEKKIITNENTLWTPQPSDINKALENKTSVVDFLDGKWLEWYILDKVKNIEGITGYGCGLQANKPNTRNFELDVFLIKGYQLIGISVTTAGFRNKKIEKYLCKSKGFEVIHRTKQIGGDEAKSVLITGLDSNSALELEKDIQGITGSAEEHFKVFGKDDIKDIETKIKDFVGG